MMAQYGYITPQAGNYQPPNPYKPIKAPSLAQAATQTDPYGLSTPKNDTVLGLGGPATPKAAAPPYSAAQVTSSLAANPQASSGAYGITRTGQTVGAAMPNIVSAATTPTAGALGAYDINTDPAYALTASGITASDSDVQAAADKQIRDQLLAYGDPTLAASLGDPTLAQAAAGNPTSTVAGLSTQYHQNAKTLDDELNANNLIYSGYRVNQQQQAATDYQNALAQAAAAVNGNIDQIHQNLSTALFNNKMSLSQATGDAESRLAAAAANAGVDPGNTSTVPPEDQAAIANTGGSGESGGAARTGTSYIAPSALTQPYKTSALIQALASASRNRGAGRGNLLQ